MAKWLEGCEVCSAGLIKEMDGRIGGSDLSEHMAAKQLALEAKEELGYPLFSGKQLRDRYRYHKNKDKKGTVYSSKNNSQEQLQSLIPGSELAEIPPVPELSPTKKKPSEGPRVDPRCKRRTKPAYPYEGEDKLGEYVTVRIDKLLANNLMELARKGAFGSGRVGMELDTLIGLFLATREKSGRAKLKQVALEEAEKKPALQLSHFMSLWDRPSIG